MTAANHIRYLRHQDIDLAKWDACIDQAPNGLIYGRSFYLDQLSAHWDALVLNDYQAVMPLTWNKKYGFHYLYQPWFSTALGVFGALPPDLPVAQFLAAIPKKFKYWDFALNEFNELQPSPAYHLTPRVNYFLNLARPYEAIAAGYKRLAARALRKALDHNLEIIRQPAAAQLIGHYRNAYPSLGVPDEGYDRLHKCLEIAAEKGNIKNYLARTADGEIVAFYCLLADEKFVYSLLGGSTPKGKEMAAFYLLTDAAIRDHAADAHHHPATHHPGPDHAGPSPVPRIFRFEGSDISGIAFFNAQFGAGLTHYPYLVSNRLPWPLKWAKPSRHKPLTR